VSKPAEFIQPPNTLRLKVGGAGFGGIDAAAIARAEAALKDLSSQFGEWLNDEVNKMDAARAEIRTKGATAETLKDLYLRAHDLKGLGATYEFPIVTRISASLCKLIDDHARMQAPLFLVDAHIDAIKAMVRDSIREDTHPVGRVLVMELESRTTEHLATL
jgi:hypothetical protein